MGVSQDGEAAAGKHATHVTRCAFACLVRTYV